MGWVLCLKEINVLHLFCYEIIKVLIVHVIFEAEIYIADITMHVISMTMSMVLKGPCAGSYSMILYIYVKLQLQIQLIKVPWVEVKYSLCWVSYIVQQYMNFQTFEKYKF